MMYASAEQVCQPVEIQDLKEKASSEKQVKVHGAVHIIREMGDVSFGLSNASMIKRRPSSI